MFGDIKPPDSRWRRVRARAALILLPITFYLLLRDELWVSNSANPFCGSKSASEALAFIWFFLFAPIAVSILAESLIRTQLAKREGIELSLFSPIVLWTAGVRVKGYLAAGVGAALFLELVHRIVSALK